MDRLIRLILKQGLDFEAYFSHLQKIETKRKWHFTWLLTHLVEIDPNIGKRHQALIWNELRNTDHQGMMRDLWRSFTFIKIDDELSGEIFNTGMSVIRSQKYPIAVRAHCMLVLTRIALPYAELRKELMLVFKELVNDESAGIRARSKNLWHRLESASRNEENETF